MGQPAAKQGDQVIGTDTHIVLVPSASGAPEPKPLPHPFSGVLDGNLSQNVRLMGRPAAVVGSTASNQPPHIPTIPGSFQFPPRNSGQVQTGSSTVMINGKPAARHGDMVQTCYDLPPSAPAKIVAAGTVLVGG